MNPAFTRSAALRSVVAGTLAVSAWLLISAMPVLADGGPHDSSAFSGADGLDADICAQCHRTHTAVGPFLLGDLGGGGLAPVRLGSVSAVSGASFEEALCFSCHGAAGLGATTNVEDGVQYGLASAYERGAAEAGALRGGGFVTARIDSAHSSRKSYPVLSGTKLTTSFSSKVGVLHAGAPATSAHLDVDGAAGVIATGKAWGNGEPNSGPGPTVELTCTSCHNPHGNGKYRILNPIPTAPGLASAPTAAIVTDGSLLDWVGTAATTRNYTVQGGKTLADVVNGTYVNDGAAGTPDPYAGDYWRKYLPWNIVPVLPALPARQVPSLPSTGHAGDVPMYVRGAADNLTLFRIQISAWCASCHSRYLAGDNPPEDSGDADYTYRHQTDTTECTQCHVAHGSDSAMTGTNSSTIPYPDDDPLGTRHISSSSRLLKIDNRGTCQACHDPTLTLPYDGSVITH